MCTVSSMFTIDVVSFLESRLITQVCRNMQQMEMVMVMVTNSKCVREC